MIHRDQVLRDRSVIVIKFKTQKITQLGWLNYLMMSWPLTLKARNENQELLHDVNDALEIP